MLVLTPPFQVPDEPAHFQRAYQLSQLQIVGTLSNGAAGGMLPSNLIDLNEDFLGKRAIYAPPPLTAQPSRKTWRVLGRSLDADRREFVDFRNTVIYSPAPYLPQVIAIALGRWAGAGPLMLLYLARLANALTAVLLLIAAVRLMPIAPEAMMLVGLLPMALCEYASASADAAVITTAFLFTAVALRGQLRGTWTVGEVLIATVSGLVFCSSKLVYAPLLVLALPALLSSGRAKHTLLVHAIILTVVLGGTAIWLHLSFSTFMPPQWTNPSKQVIYIAAHPFAYLKAIVAALVRYSPFYYASLVGYLGWLSLRLPMYAYFLPATALLWTVLAQPWSAPRLPAVAAAWNILILASSVVLIMTAAYLVWSQVGWNRVEGIQGRYFIPLVPLSVATACSVVRLQPSRDASRLAFLAVAAVIGAEILTAQLSIVRAYHIF